MEDDPLPAEVGERQLVAVLIGQGEVGGEVALLDHRADG